MPSSPSEFSPRSAHPSFPLSFPVLEGLSLSPEFEYQQPSQARYLNALLGPAHPTYTPAEIAAAGLLGRIYLRVLSLFLARKPSAFAALDAYLLSSLGRSTANRGFAAAVEHFPTSLSYQSPTAIPKYTLGEKASPELRHAYFQSLVLILTADQNPVFTSRDGLFTDPALRRTPAFQALSKSLTAFYRAEPGPAGGDRSLLDFLLEPVLAQPNSLFGQLEFIRQNWSFLLDEDLLGALLTGLDRLREEHRPAVLAGRTAGDPLGGSLPSYLMDSDSVRFSADQDWMPRMILLAKNVYVWLDQLSRLYQRPIYRLDHIPEEEFARLSDWGITGLWLIGLWERSPASQQIKQLTGNPDAVPSAYSLYDYDIAEALGGEQGFGVLQEMAARHRIKLAADMVPNHMGIYSRWVIEHPDWFLSLPDPPFPGYSFSGQDLSRDPSVGIFLEDHYYDKTDAAVVFKRTDRASGRTRYIYHGNDGTAMPWNDTAQLNFLDPAVREAVIQTILHVARKFPVIRFDAAMTLAKKHFQRLWFPAPGSGGAIPTRSDFSLSKDEFDRLMPAEFWREVVDRVAAEVPDTLLLAEAFWMMEGYFVRTLGMHRVYNSAFMHMLRDEDNAKYRDLIIKTLDYDPQILKRYVNFMNNPDEDTAISQFGSDGKYFGTCVLMSTLPGLPMFGHGQIEGFTEKYGMEYKRAYYDETPSQFLIDRHKREIFPLLHRRSLFAEADNFVLYDLTLADGSVNQDVFAYSNRSGLERALVLYHNKWGDTAGQLRFSAEVKGARRTLLDGLGFSGKDGDYLLFRDLITGLEYIRSLPDLAVSGLSVALGAYRYQVFVDFKPVKDGDGSYAQLAEMLGGSGAPALERTRQSLRLAPICSIMAELYALSGQFSERPSKDDRRLKPVLALIPSFLVSAGTLFPPAPAAGANQRVAKRVQGIARHWDILRTLEGNPEPYIAFAAAFLAELSDADLVNHSSALADGILQALPSPAGAQAGQHQLGKRDLDTAIAMLPAFRNASIDFEALVGPWLTKQIARDYLQIHDYDGTEWFNQESFESLLAISLCLIFSLQIIDPVQLPRMAEQLPQLYRAALKALQNSNYQVSLLKELAFHSNTQSGS